MAERNGDNNFLLSWPVIAALLATICGGTIYLQTPLKSSRPSGSSEVETNSFGNQTIEARLWQDPFEAIHSSVAKWDTRPSGNASHGLHEMVRQIQFQLKSKNDSPAKISIFQVVVPGGPYAEDKETRLRSRYAVLSALQSAGYYSRDENHIGWFELPWLRERGFQMMDGHTVPSLNNSPRNVLFDIPWLDWLVSTNVPDPKDSSASTRPLFIPYEWFDLDTNQPAATNRNYGTVLVWWLRDDALNDHPLQRVALLREALSAGRDFRTLNFALINPNLSAIFSDDLGQLANLSISGRNEEVPLTNYLANLSVFSAWSTIPDALLCAGSTTNRRETISNILDHLGIHFHNVACTDDQLAASLIAELGLRGVDFAKGGNLALLSERDTKYGRSLPLTFMKALTNKEAKIYLSSYLRGVDGLLADQSGERAASGKDNAENTKEKSKEERVDELEKPEGQSQLDYMPRLAQSLRNLDRDQHLAAIGVLGGDVYDKLLLFQSLRKRFPDAVFFTTDLDARLLHPTEWNWTQNLIVSSSFGLELGEELQGDVPPFRDTYQTGTFLACKAALGDAGALTSLGNIRPRLFEVGRRGAYPLDICDKDPLYRGRPKAFDAAKTAWLAILGFMGLAIFIVGAYFYVKPPPAWFYFATVGGMVVLMVTCYYTIRYSHLDPAGEPFSILDSLSIWPTEIVRVMALALSMALFYWILHRIKTDVEKLTDDFLLKGGTDSTVAAEWNEFKKSGDSWLRSKRVFILTVLYALFATVVCMRHPSFLHSRGYSRSIDKWVAGLSGFALWGLMFLVVDVALRGRRFAAFLSEKSQGWPADLVKLYLPVSLSATWRLPLVNEWLSVQFLAKLTANIEAFVYWPFIVLLLMIAARFVGGFHWSVPLLVVSCLNAFIVFGTALWLHRSARDARDNVIDRLEEKLFIAQCGGRVAEKKHTQAMIDKINEVDQGSFAPLSQQPFIRAVLIPLAGAALAWVQQ